MQRSHTLFLTLLLVGARLTGAPAAQSPHVVVVELFTAQGCSSCPPADRLLTALGQDPSITVVPLAFHVDSWNTLGWMDPFSKPEWTRRQEFYARMLRARAVYTPQAVIDGRAELLGSDEPALRAAVAQAAAEPAASVTIILAPNDREVAVEAQVEVPEALRDRKLDVMVAIYETGLVTPVKRGENGGKTLRDDYVVRILKRALRFDGRNAGPARAAITLPIAKDWKRENLGVAAFVQDSRALSIHGAAASALVTHQAETRADASLGTMTPASRSGRD